MNINELLAKIKQHPDQVEFDQVIECIENHYVYTPGQFTNGQGENKIINAAGDNEGSCKIFAFSKKNGLDKRQTLACFGRFYREDVLSHPNDSDHANIRTFMLYGVEGIELDKNILVAR